MIEANTKMKKKNNNNAHTHDAALCEIMYVIKSRFDSHGVSQ